MSIFVNVSGSRFIECNCCGKIAASNHGIIVNNLANDIPPIDWNTELLRIPCNVGHNWKLQHFCPDCQRKA